MHKAWLLAPAAFLAAAFFWPLAATLTAADAQAWAWALGHPLVRDRIVGAAWMALLSVLLTFALAVPLAWLHHRYRVPMGRVQMAFHAAPFVLPVFVIVFGIQAVFGAGGWTHRMGLDVLGALGPLGAVVIAHAYYNYGFAARLIHAALARRPHRLEAAARVLGASPAQAFMRTTLPLLAPAFISVALLVFLFAFTSFGVVLYMGGGQVATLEVLLYENLRGAFPRNDRAAALGILQLLVNFALLAGYMALIRRQERLPNDSEPSRQRAWAAPIGWATVVLGLAPAVAVLVGGFQVRGTWSMEPWRALLDTGHPSHVGGFELGHALGLSLLYAAGSAIIALLLTLVLAYGVRTMRPWARQITEIVAALPLGTSSLLIGFGIILATSVSFIADPARGRWLIIAAHALVAFPFTARAMLPAIRQLDGRLDAAAAVLGAHPRAVFWRVHAPQLKAPAIAAAGLAIAMSLGDFGASLLLMNSENRGISVWIDAMSGVQFNPVVRGQARALAGLLMVMAAGAYAAVEMVQKEAPWR